MEPSPIDQMEEEEEEITRQVRPLELEDVRKMDPYTLHRHPVYVSATALFSYLRSSSE